MKKDLEKSELEFDRKIKEESGNIIKNEKNQNNLKGENIYINYFTFDLNYEIITPILKE